MLPAINTVKEDSMSKKQQEAIKKHLNTIIEMNDAGRNIPDICKELGIPYSGARTILESKHGFSPKRHAYNKGRRPSEAQIDPWWPEILEKLKLGFSAMELSELYNVKYITLYHYAKRRVPELVSLSPSDRVKNRYAEIRTTFDLSKDELYKLYQVDNLTMDEISSKTGYCRSTIYNWIHKYNIPIKTIEEITEKLWDTGRREYYRQLCYEGVTGVFKDFYPYGASYTSIEQEFADWCKSHDIGYEFQHQITEGGHRYDFLINGTKLLVETDGVYWHSGEKQQERDRMQEKLAIEEGYDIIRFTDKEIQKTKGKCFEKVLEWMN
jgi:very-short-patch-repair endonuclease/predicted DNA-binding protein YlxM (UPF0122 family)